MNTQHDITVSGKPLNPPKPPAKPHMLLWIDTETTGLDPNQCELLEVGMQVTDLKAETRGGSLHLIVHPDNVRNWTMHPEMLKAYEMHLANGLMLACAEAPKTGNTIYSAHRSLTQDDMYRDTATLALLRWITHLEQFSQITNQTKEDA